MTMASFREAAKVMKREERGKFSTFTYGFRLKYLIFAYVILKTIFLP